MLFSIEIRRPWRPFEYRTLIFEVKKPVEDDLSFVTMTVTFKQSSTGREEVERRTVTGWIHALMYTKL